MAITRVSSEGMHLTRGGMPFRMRGVTYGTFGPRADGALFPGHHRVRDDFRAMADAGLNTVRIYTVPPDDVLELAGEHGLQLLVGIDYHDWRIEPRPGVRAQRRVLDAGRRAVAETMERLAGRPEVAAVAVGNEIPGDIVRVHGIHHVERALSALVADVHAADPEMLATYVNFPTTEYLQVEGQDLVCFNVFLERTEQLRRYLRHLQVVAGDLPLVVTELGLASELHGEDAQAESVAAQLRLVDECGLAGATVFAWTDEWNVGGNDIEGWGFGLTDAERNPRPALETVSRWARSSIRDLREEWPRVSVVVCAYQAADTIEECLTSLVYSKYPDLEVIVCDDGSTDDTGRLARRFPFTVLDLPRGGLSNARNAGVAAATGEIVAFLDADAACHPEWPYHLALSLEDENVVATGGPNLPVPEAGLVERVVAASPGGPIHVLVSDDRAEHVPGCNMAFRREALEEIGYFDPVYTAAGDDVDVCWKLLDRGYEIGFSAAAQVLHHRRPTVRGYVRQQLGYGKAERLMASRHRHRFNRLGQARWGGFIYGTPALLSRLLRPVVYHGSMGSAPFQPVVGRRAEAAHAWVGAVLPLFVPILLLGLLGMVSPWFFLAPALALATAVGYAGAVARSVHVPHAEPRPVAFRLLAAYLHVVQPLARTWGRLRARVPEAVANGHRFAWLGDRSAWLDGLARQLASSGGHVRFSEAHESWDLELRKGPFLRARITTAVLWGWTPSHRVRYGLRWTILLPLAAAAAVAAWLGVQGLWVLGFLGLTLVLETLALTRAVGAALRVTTEGARGEVAEERHEAPVPARRRPEYARERS